MEASEMRLVLALTAVALWTRPTGAVSCAQTVAACIDSTFVGNYVPISHLISDLLVYNFFKPHFLNESATHLACDTERGIFGGYQKCVGSCNSSDPIHIFVKQGFAPLCSEKASDLSDGLRNDGCLDDHLQTQEVEPGFITTKSSDAFDSCIAEYEAASGLLAAAFRPTKHCALAKLQRQMVACVTALASPRCKAQAGAAYELLSHLIDSDGRRHGCIPATTQ